MNFHKKYKITIEDEAHLAEVATLRLTGLGMWCAVAGVIIGSLLIAGLLISVSPIRTLLPGYLKETQRSATEEGLLRLDSLMEAYEVNNAYIDNYFRVTDTEREPIDSAAVVPVSRELTSDSLMTATNEEQRFVSQMEERERFNISVLAPLAADGVAFSPVTADGIFTTESKSSEEGIIIMPYEESIQCVADGAVIALYYSPTERGYVLALQHPKGFVTTYSGTGTPLVGIGDNVNSGQIIALAPAPDSKGTRKFKIRMWHNGLAIIPYEYLGLPGHSSGSETESFESPRGRL